MAEFWRTAGQGTAYATLTIGNHREHWPIRNTKFRQWLARQFFAKHGKVPSSQAVQDAVNVIEGQATYEGREHPVYVRIGGDADRVYLDLVNDAWQVVEIDKAGWRIVGSADCPIRFRRAKGMKPLPTPESGGRIETLRQFVNVDDNGWRLLRGWILAAFRPTGPYPILALHGEQGSAKTSTALVVQRIVDPNAGDLRAEPKVLQNLMLAANNSWILAFDNLSHVSPDLSDSLCRLSTGGGFATRLLYTDDEEAIFQAKRPMLLTGIEELATRSDLLDRSLPLHLPRIPDGKRMPEADFWFNFDIAAPGILGAILDAVSAAIQNLPTTQISDLPRMADFALWATAGESALGMAPGEFMEAYRANREDANAIALESNPVSRYVLQLADTGGWAGTPSDLHQKLETMATDQERYSRSWPKSAKTLSGLLRRLAPNLRAVGVEVNTDGHTGRGNSKKRRIEISTRVDATGAQGDDGGHNCEMEQSPQNTALGTQGTQGTQVSNFYSKEEMERERNCLREKRTDSCVPNVPSVPTQCSAASTGDARRGNGQEGDASETASVIRKVPWPTKVDPRIVAAPTPTCRSCGQRPVLPGQPGRPDGQCCECSVKGVP